MKYLFISPTGDGFSLAYKLKQLGEDAAIAFLGHDDAAMGKDMGVDIVEDFHKVLMDTPKDKLIIIFDVNGAGYTADYLTQLGYYVMGGSSWADSIEEEREEGRKVMEMMTDTPQTQSFTDFDIAKRFVKANSDTRFVFKPDGEVPKEWTYVSKESSDLLDRLDFYEEHWSKSIPVSFELQEYIDGIECDFCGVFNGTSWIENAFEWYFEDKKAYDGNKGPATGCADALQFYTTSKEPYFQNYLKKLTPLLREKKYKGIFSVNNIYDINTDTFYPLELTPRLGYDSTQNEVHAMIHHGSNPANFFKAVAMGQSLPKAFFPLNLYSFDVRVSIPPYPFFEGADYASGVQHAKGKVVSIPDAIHKDFFPDDIYYNEDEEQYECAGVCGTLGVMASSEETIDGAISNLYDNLMPQIHAPDMFYRTDGGERVKKDVQTLIDHGAILPRTKL